MIPDPSDVPYMSFIFGLIFCILNSLQGVFIFVCCHVINKLRIKEAKDTTEASSSNRKTQSTTVKESGNFDDLQELPEIEFKPEFLPDY